MLLHHGEDLQTVIVHSLDIMTIAVPPALATCLTIASEIATSR